MALVTSGTHGSTPGLMYELYADQTGGSGNSRTIKLTLYLKCAGSSSSWYGYPMNWSGHINGAWSSWMHAKGTETWRGSDGWRSYTWTYTTDIGTTSSKSIQVGFQTDSYSGDNSWDLVRYGNFTTGSTNTPPSMSGAVTTKYKVGSGDWILISNASSGTENAIKIPETANYIRCEWVPGTDDKGEGNLTYSLSNQQSESSWTVIYSGREKSYEHNIGTGNEGRSYDYYVTCKDADGATSNTIDGLQFQKNEFTGAGIASSSSIGFQTKSILVTYSGATNTDGNTAFSYSVECNDITLYNGVDISQNGTQEIAIWRDGDLPTVPYFKFDELKNRYSETAYKGNVRIILKTRNQYGTTKNSEVLVPINLQIAPIAVTEQKVDLETSTAYATIVNKQFFVPSEERSINVSWVAGKGLLGEIVSYEVYISFDGGSTFTKIADVNSSTLVYSHMMGKVAAKTTIRYRIRIKTEYGLYSDSDTEDYILHYVDEPILSIEDMLRASTEFTFYAQVKTTTSLTKEDVDIQTVGSWIALTKAEAPIEVSNGKLAATQNRQKVIINNLKDNGQYVATITYNDNTNLFKDKTYPIAIGVNSPIVFINKYGLGIGSLKANKNYSLVVNGSMNVEGAIHINGKPIESGGGVPGDFLPRNGPATFMTNGATQQDALIFKGTKVSGRIWAGSGGLVLQSDGEYNLHLGVGDTGDMVFTKSDITAGKDFVCNKYLKINAWTGYGSGTGNLWFDGNNKRLISSNVDVLETHDTSAWKSLDLWRDGARTRYGIGANTNGPSPSIEFFGAENPTSYISRLNIAKNCIQFFANDTPSCWLGFYSGSTRQGYVGRGSNDDNLFRVYAETGDLVLSTNYRIQASGHFHPSNDNIFYLGLTSPAGRWKQLCSVSPTINTSDYRYKKDIRPILLNQSQPVTIDNYNKPYSVESPRYGSPTSEDYYNFVKSDLRLYEYSYILPNEAHQGLTHEQLEDAEKASNIIGFMADDYEELKYNKVAQRFIFRTSDGVLNYNTGNYTNVLANALKVAILKIDSLEVEIKNIQKKLDKLEKM